MGPNSDYLPILQALHRLYQDATIPNRLVAPDEAAAYWSLIAAFGDIGEAGRTIEVEINVLPGLSSAAEGIHIVQLFVPSLSLEGRSASMELLRFINRINLNLPIGSFFIVEDAGTICFKANCIVDANQPADWNAGYIDRNNGLLIYVHDLFLDALEAVVSDELSFEDAMQRTSLL